MEATVKRSLNEWAEAKKAELSPRVRRLIELANWNLHHGPDMTGQDDEQDDEKTGQVRWPGFEQACNEIRDALESVCQDVWLDVQSGNFQTEEPTPGESYEDVNPDYDPENPDSKEFIIVPDEVNWEDWRLIEARQVGHAILGELASYCY